MVQRHFTREEVREIMSELHRIYTAMFLRKDCAKVTADELIDHWLRTHAYPRPFPIPKISAR